MVPQNRPLAALFAILTLAVLAGATPAAAHPTGAPLVTYPVHPCRILDTRVAGPALPAYTGMDGYVRGSQLQTSDGAAQSDCGVPADAEAVRVNIAAASPIGDYGYLQIHARGWVYGPMGAYSRLNYGPSWVSNEMEITLCNLSSYPYPQAACPYDGLGRYLDFQIVNQGPGRVHVVGDVVGYLKRHPSVP